MTSAASASKVGDGTIQGKGFFFLFRKTCFNGFLLITKLRVQAPAAYWATSPIFFLSREIFIGPSKSGHIS